MARTVETIAANFVFLIVFIWKSIEISLCRHCLMECRIKYCHHRYIWHDFLTCIDTDEICRIVQWCQIIALRNRLDYFIVDDNGSRKFLATMHDTVSNRIDLIQ